MFCYPRLSIFLSYEAMGEGTTLCYVMAAFLAFAAATQQKKCRLRFFAFAGLMAGLAINTKMLSILSIGGILVWAGMRWLIAPVEERKARFTELLFFGNVAAGLQLFWELLQMLVLVRLTNLVLYLTHLRQRLGFIRDEGSGLGGQKHVGVDFLWRKFILLREVAHPQAWVTVVIFAFILFGSVALILSWCRRRPYAHNLLAVIWLGWLANTAWFVTVAKTGWPRHFWFGLMLATVLLSVIPVALVRQYSDEGEGEAGHRLPAILGPVAGSVLAALLVWGFAGQPHVWSVLLPDEIVPYWLERRVDYYDYAGLPWVVIPRAHQAEVVEYINNLPPEASVYYPERHKAAEIAPQTGRIQYPLQRRFHPTVKPHPADIVLVPPSLISAWRFEPAMHQELLRRVEAACPNPVLRNDYYIICLADQVRLP